MKRLFKILDVGVTLLACAFVISRLRRMNEGQRTFVRRAVEKELRRPVEPVTIDGEFVDVSA